MFGATHNFRIVILQSAITLVVAMAAFWLSSGASIEKGVAQGLGALYAGTALVAPNAWFASVCQVQKQPGKLLVTGVIRWYLSVALMAGAIIIFKPPAAGFFTALVLCQGAYLLSPKMT